LLIKIWPDIPVILGSGYTESISLEKAKQMGVKDYLMKPIAMKKLADCIRKVLDTE
jgi:CheY-like chemotaxis protein